MAAQAWQLQLTEALPSELLCQIVGSLPNADAASAALTCRALHTAVAVARYSTLLVKPDASEAFQLSTLRTLRFAHLDPLAFQDAPKNLILDSLAIGPFVNLKKVQLLGTIDLTTEVAKAIVHNTPPRLSLALEYPGCLVTSQRAARLLSSECPVSSKTACRL